MVIVQVLQAREVWSSRVSVGSAVATMVPSIETMRMAKHAVPKIRWRRRPSVGSACPRRTEPSVWRSGVRRADGPLAGGYDLVDLLLGRGEGLGPARPVQERGVQLRL